jgi:hypothetical protein
MNTTDPIDNGLQDLEGQEGILDGLGHNEAPVRYPVSPETLQHVLDSASGSDRYYHRGMSFYYTDGVKFLADQGGCHWLIDAIYSWQISPRVRREPFQVWTLRTYYSPNQSQKYAVLTADDGGKDGKPPARIASQNIPYTDFPLDEIKLYVELGSVDAKHEAQILLLPAER